MTFNLPGGFKVIATRVADGTEFETSNAEGDTISTVRLADDPARDMTADLSWAAA